MTTKLEGLVRFPPPVLRRKPRAARGSGYTPASVRGRGPDVISSQLEGVHQRSLIEQVDVMSDLLADIRQLRRDHRAMRRFCGCATSLSAEHRQPPRP